MVFEPIYSLPSVGVHDGTRVGSGVKLGEAVKVDCTSMVGTTIVVGAASASGTETAPLIHKVDTKHTKTVNTRKTMVTVL